MHNDFWGSSLSRIKPHNLKGVADVEVVGLDDLLRTSAPTMLIMDVEGGEADLLDDDLELTGVTKLLMEIHPKVIGLAGVKKIFDVLSRQGLVYDASTSSGRVILFRRLEA